MIDQKGRTLLIILLIAAAIGGYLIYSGKINLNKPQTSPSPTTQSSPETANWKTYENSKYGFSINYPSGWKFSTDNYLNSTKDYIIFSTYEDTHNGSRLELYKDFIGGFCEGPAEIKETVFEFNNGIKAKRSECPSTIAISFQKDGNNLWLIAQKVNDKNRDLFNQAISTFKFTDQTFKSEKGSFAIDLPSEMKMIERPERIEGGVTKGEVWFTFGQFDEHAPSGMVVTYGKPIIDGKGGACGEGGYKNEMISGQKVQVCETNSVFSASYFTNPNKKIEYHISTARLSTEQLKIVSEAVRKTLRFE